MVVGGASTFSHKFGMQNNQLGYRGGVWRPGPTVVAVTAR